MHAFLSQQRKRTTCRLTLGWGYPAAGLRMKCGRHLGEGITSHSCSWCISFFGYDGSRLMHYYYFSFCTFFLFSAMSPARLDLVRFENYPT